MPIITLTDNERDKFARWLQQEADSNRTLIEQMKKLPGLNLEPVSKKLAMEAVASMMIATKLLNTETVEIPNAPNSSDA